VKLCDDVAVIAATRLAGGRVVTAAGDAMKFRSPVKVGDVITLRATVNAAWRTSMEVGVRVAAEHVPTGEVAHTCTAYLTLVALGEDEKPVPPPALEPEIPRTSGASATPTTAAGSGSQRPANCAASALSGDTAKSAASRARARDPGDRERSGQRDRAAANKLDQVPEPSRREASGAGPGGERGRMVDPNSRGPKPSQVGGGHP